MVNKYSIDKTRQSFFAAERMSSGGTRSNG